MTVNYSNVIHSVQILDPGDGLNRLKLGWAFVGLKINTYAVTKIQVVFLPALLQKPTLFPIFHLS